MVEQALDIEVYESIITKDIMFGNSLLGCLERGKSGLVESSSTLQAQVQLCFWRWVEGGLGSKVFWPEAGETCWGLLMSSWPQELAAQVRTSVVHLPLTVLDTNGHVTI